MLFLTKFLIAEPKAAHGDIDNGHIIKATIAIDKIDKIKFPSFGKNPDAAILDIVQAFGSAIRNMVKNNKIKALIEYFLAILLLITAIIIVLQ